MGQTTGKPDLDIVGAVMTWEDAEASMDERLNAMQMLVDTGVVWKLQGSYGRSAERLIKLGLIRSAPELDVLRAFPSTAGVDRGDGRRT